MNKTVTYRKFLSLSLIVVFISPLLIIAAHFLYVHHEPHHISKSDKPQVYEKHNECPICAFKFVEFIAHKKPQKTSKPELILVYYSTYLQNTYITESYYSFNLRAPPVNK